MTQSEQVLEIGVFAFLVFLSATTSNIAMLNIMFSITLGLYLWDIGHYLKNKESFDIEIIKDFSKGYEPLLPLITARVCPWAWVLISCMPRVG